jgi:hypothetical protein
MLHSHRRVSPISRFAANDRDPRADSRFPAKAGNGGFPDSRFRPNRESGIPSPIPGEIGNRGNGNWGFPGLRPRGAARSVGVKLSKQSTVAWKFELTQVRLGRREGSGTAAQNSAEADACSRLGMGRLHASASAEFWGSSYGTALQMAHASHDTGHA